MKKSTFILLIILFPIASLLVKGEHITDWLNYTEYFKKAEELSIIEFINYTPHLEVGFDLFVLLLAKLRLPSISLLFFSIYLVLYMLAYSMNISAKKNINIIFILIIICSDYPLISILDNTLRQNMALGICTLGIFHSKRWFLLAPFFHISSIGYIGMYIISKTRLGIWFILGLFIFRNDINLLFSNYTHQLYDPPSTNFMILLGISTAFLFFIKHDLRKLAMVFFLTILLIYPTTQISSRFVLYGHLFVLIAFINFLISPNNNGKIINI